MRLPREIIWPVHPSFPPDFQEDQEQPQQPATLMDSRSWIGIRNAQVTRLPEIRKMSTRHYVEPLYSHLPNSEIDWDLDAPASACHVVGLSYQGRDLGRVNILKKHLQRKMHVQHDANFAQRQAPSLPSPTTSTNSTKREPIDYMSPPSTIKKPRVGHMVGSSELIGHDLELPLKPRDEVLEWPRTFKYPFWLELPDSDVDE